MQKFVAGLLAGVLITSIFFIVSNMNRSNAIDNAMATNESNGITNGEPISPVSIQSELIPNGEQIELGPQLPTHEGDSQTASTPEDPSITYSPLTYHGKKNVVSGSLAEGKEVRNVNHYTFTMEEGNPINIYVTDAYDDLVGKGFAYEEVGAMIKAIATERKMKPYANKARILNLYFITNDPTLNLPLEYQAAANRNNNVSEVIMNADTMPYDFRDTLVHELYHYFDFHYYSDKYMEIFDRYWGNDWRFWLLEGAAEYASYTIYDVPKNSHNTLTYEPFKGNKIAHIIEAKKQGGNRVNLLVDNGLDHFGKLFGASSNNYGITRSFYAYLVDVFGKSKIEEYTSTIYQQYGTTRQISNEMRDDTAKSIFGKTEKEILSDWLVYFEYFGGELQPFMEINSVTVQALYWKDDSDLPDWAREYTKMEPVSNFYVRVKDSSDQDWHYDNFLQQSTQQFRLVADGEEKLSVSRKGGFYTGGFNGTHWHLQKFEIDPADYTKMKPGVKYHVEPVKNNSQYSWTFPENVTIVKKK